MNKTINWSQVQILLPGFLRQRQLDHNLALFLILECLVKMTEGNITAMLSSFNDIQLKLNEAAGQAVMVEVRMRLIGQLSKEVRSALKEVVEKHRRENPKASKSPRDFNYWECNLCFLDDAIDLVSAGKLTSEECQQVGEFRGLRNELLHGDFIDLMTLLKITPTGSEIYPKSKTSEKRNILKVNKDEKVPYNYKEAVLSIARNHGFEEIRKRAVNVIVILDKLLRTLLSA